MTAVPQLLGPGQGEDIAGRIRIKCASEELVLTETAGAGATEPHIHHHHADAFFVLEGELTVRLATEEHVLAPGDFALAPPALVHCYRSAGARWLNLHAPGCNFQEWLRSGLASDFDQHPPPQGGGRPAGDGVLLRQGEGELVELGPATQARVKAGTGDGPGSVTVAEFELAAGSPGSPPRRHAAIIDAFYVLDGTPAVLIGDREHEAPPGSCAVITPGNLHAISNPGSAPVRYLNVIAPGGSGLSVS